MIRVTHYLRHPQSGVFSMERLYEDVRAYLPQDITVSLCINRFLSRSFFKRVYDIVRARQYQGDVNHVTGDVHYLTYLLDSRRTILTIHDCVTLERLRGIKRWLFWLCWYWLPEKRCAAITVVSEATRRQVLRHLRCDPGKIRVIHNNVSKEFTPDIKAFNSPNPCILHIGTTVNKNLERVAAALQGIKCKLVIVGNLSVSQIQVLRQHGVDFENHLNLSRDALVAQYRDCDMLVFASTYEGFGLPIVEANAVGRPVVTSTLWSMPEVAGDAACLVDPFNIASIRAGILRVIEDAAYRERLVENGFANVQRFQCEAISAQYADLYRSLYSRRETPSRSAKYCE